MEPIVDYLEDTEKKLMMEMAGLFNTMREQRNTMSFDGIEHMYNSKPLEGVLYDPCVRIPCTHLFVKGHPITLYYCSEYKLPTNETIVFVKETLDCGSQNSPGTKHYCIALTNYGRFIRTYPVSANSQFGGYSYYSPTNDGSIHDGTHGQSPNSILPIIKLDPLSYKLPSWFLQSFITHDVLYADPNNQKSICYRGTKQHPNTLLECLNASTNTLQELNKEFYLFAGKWKPHMTERATLDVDTMRETGIKNTACIHDLSEKNKSLEEQNKTLEEELKQLKEQKAALEKERATLLPLEKYKEAVIDFMDEHYTGKEPYDHDDTLDTDIITYFSNWHLDKLFMDEWEYDDVMESKEELNEYRIYKKVKAEMVSSGMDSSDTARNVRSINKSIRDRKSIYKLFQMLCGLKEKLPD